MPLVPGICTQCGAVLSVDESKECFICPYCNTPFISEKAIHQFNNTYNINAQNVYIQGGGHSDFEIVAGILYQYKGKSRDVIIPSDVCEIKGGSFPHRITSIELPEGLKEIGEATFANCSELKQINIPDSVTTIGSRAFSDCTSLKYVKLPKSLNAIEAGTFENCQNLTDITIPENIVSIGEQAFYNCRSLTNITIPECVKSVGDGAFAKCQNLISITIQADLEGSLGVIFADCNNVTEIKIKGNMKIDSKLNSFPLLQSFQGNEYQSLCIALDNPTSPYFPTVDQSTLGRNFNETLKREIAYNHIGSQFAKEYFRAHKKCIHCGGELATFRGSCIWCGKPME